MVWVVPGFDQWNAIEMAVFVPWKQLSADFNSSVQVLSPVGKTARLRFGEKEEKEEWAREPDSPSQALDVPIIQAGTSCRWMNLIVQLA